MNHGTGIELAGGRVKLMLAALVPASCCSFSPPGPGGPGGPAGPVGAAHIQPLGH